MTFGRKRETVCSTQSYGKSSRYVRLSVMPAAREGEISIVRSPSLVSQADGRLIASTRVPPEVICPEVPTVSRAS